MLRKIFDAASANDAQNVDPANVVQSLVYTLLDVFDATRDLYNTLRKKERRDYERSLRSRGYPESRKLEYVDDDEYASDEGIVMDKAAVTRQFDIGFQDIGTPFAVGDGMLVYVSGSNIPRGQRLICGRLNSRFANCNPVADHHPSVCHNCDLFVRPYLERSYHETTGRYISCVPCCW